MRLDATVEEVHSKGVDYYPMCYCKVAQAN